MPRDVELSFESASRTITTDAKSTNVLNTPGGGMAMVRATFGAFSGASTTLDINVEVSIDGGTDWFKVGKLPQLGPSSDDTIGTKPLARMFYIPRPEAGVTGTKVRLDYDVAGSSPSYVLSSAFLEPLLSLSPPATDERNTEGLALLI